MIDVCLLMVPYRRMRSTKSLAYAINRIGSSPIKKRPAPNIKAGSWQAERTRVHGSTCHSLTPGGLCFKAMLLVLAACLTFTAGSVLTA